MRGETPWGAIVRELLAGFVGFACAIAARPGDAHAARLFDLLPGSPPAPRFARAPLASRSVDVHPETIARGDGELTFPLLDGDEAEARLIELDARGAADAFWRGSIDGGGEAMLTLAGGFVVGLIRKEDAVYELHTLADGGQALTRVDGAPFPPCGGDADAEVDLGAAHGAMALDLPGIEARSDIDVLVLFTPEARDGAGGSDAMVATVQGALDTTNAAFASSGIDARLDLAHLALADHRDASGDLAVDLYWLRNDAEVAALRDSVGADLVVLLVESTEHYCGLAQVLTTLDEFSHRRAFSVVARPCALGSLSFAHEIGHNLGMSHDPDNAGAGGLDPWSHGHWVEGRFRTIMSYQPQACPHCPLLAQFSSPRVVHEETPTGIAGERDNARTANRSAPAIAAYRTAPERRALAHADLDADGREELVVDAGAAGGLWSWRSGGGWRRLHAFSPLDLASADLDGNGRADVIAGFGAGVWAWMNDTSWVLRGGDGVDRVAAADLNGDGRDELLASRVPALGLWQSSSPSSAWKRLDGRMPELLASGDLGGDGRDEIVADFGPGQGVWTWSDGAWTQCHASSPELLASADFDGDGRADLAADFGAWGLWTRGGSSWTQRHTASPASIATGDLDADGHGDLVADFGPPHGVWSWSDVSAWTQRHTLSPLRLTLADVDGNGRAEIAADFGQARGLWLWSEAGPWAQRHRGSPELLATGDLDGNGRQELILDFGAGLGVWIWSNDATWVKRHSSSPRGAATGDLDGDGRDELVLDFGPPHGLWAWRNDAAWVKLHASSAEAMAIGDLDGNGQAELIVDFGATDGLWVRSNDSAWSARHATSPERLERTDLDGDGKDELVCDFGAAHGLWVLTGNTTWTKVHTATAELLASGDLDGDGKDELVADLGDALGLWVRRGQTWARLHDTSPELLAIGDLDGSGRDDLVVDFGAVHGIWVWSNDAAWIKRHHVSPEILAAADLDGDGTAELVVDFGPMHGVWIWRSSPGWARIEEPSPARRIAAPVCTSRPRSACHPPRSPGASVLAVAPGASPSAGRLSWRWSGDVRAADLGDPRSDSGLAICLYDAASADGPIWRAAARAAEPCPDGSCWQRDERSGALAYVVAPGKADGLRRVDLRPGAGGRGRIRVDARGAALPAARLPFDLPITAQIQSTTGECWSARFETHVQRNQPTRFRAAND